MKQASTCIPGPDPLRIQLTLTVLLEGAWISHRVGGWLGGFALHRPGWENDNNNQIIKLRDGWRCVHISV